MRAETKMILNKSFSEDEKKEFKKFAKIIRQNYRNINSQREIWKYDQKLGGYGGYVAPLNPTINLFNGLGEYRNVFRSLQYARIDMFHCCRARHIIIDSSLHIETLVKIILSKHKLLKFIYNRREFGKNIERLYKENIISKELYERLLCLKKILNYAKHDTDPKEKYTFDSMDAIVFYFEVRKIGNMLLKILNHPTCNRIYKINEVL